jgi:2-keto-4-pentenoate hydratase/2-oxohepta-3-ene-1,7-dioic acid hydratase in catechol pathway
LVTRDEISDVNNLALKTVLNGQTIQYSNTGDMTFCVQDLVGRISMLVDLEIGDIILTGTPSDLGALIPPVYLMAGDTVGVQIQDIGDLENPVIANHMSPRQHPVLSILQDN